MKKFSTRVSALVLAAAALLAGTTSAQNGPLELSKEAPDKYVVVKGDTLWDISGKFLSQPWRWPEIWALNKDQIKDPHWIYPGDIVYLDQSGDSPRLRLGRSLGQAGAGTGMGGERREVMQPMTRSQPLDRSAIPTVSSAAIEAFLNRPLIVDEVGLASHPRIVGTQEGRVYLGRGDLAYVTGLKDDANTDWHIYRPSKPLLDPDTRKPIAYEALYVGTAKLERKGDPASLRIVGTSEEVGIGDRLIPAERGRIVNYAPRAPERQVGGRIVSVYRGVAQAGRNSVVAVSVGKTDGMDVGHVLSIQHRGDTVKDHETNKMVKLPDEPIGHLLVFRVFDKISYGLIVDASTSISVGDVVATP